MHQLIELYQKHFGTAPSRIEPLAKAGSNREYVRFHVASPEADQPATCIGVIGTSRRENHSFLYLAKHFAACGLPVPRIIAYSEDEMRYLQTDLGRTSLYKQLKPARENGGTYNLEDQKLIEKTIRLLPHFQVKGSQGLNADELIPPQRFDEQAVMFDLNYFKYCFLRTSDVEFDEVALQADFDQFAKDLVQGNDSYFLYRDFQARNIMLQDGAPSFIDFQGGRLGPLEYDVASFLWQASAKYSAELRESMTDAYLDELKTLLPATDPSSFRHRLSRFVLFRQLQVLGAYGLRGRFERKKHFLDSIPSALRNLSEMLESEDLQAYPALRAIIGQLTAPRPLVVRVYSFSYKKGIPGDESGNGGGYVFDCRAPHNPGRYEPYKKLTGLDQPVIRFIEEDGELPPLLEHIYSLADFHVKRYMERGFTSLMFAFGCTGGQHRSVYCAQHLAEHISNTFGVEVRLTHREQAVSTTFPARPRPTQ